MSIENRILHIREPKIIDKPDESVQSEMETFLDPFARCLIADANYYSERSELLLKVGHRFLSSEINKLQFLVDDRDKYFCWAVQMSLKKPKNYPVIIPNGTHFVKLLRSESEKVKQVWVDETGFLYRYMGDYSGYDTIRLLDAIFLYTRISIDDSGRIFSIHTHTTDSPHSLNLIQDFNISETKKNQDQFSSSLQDPAISLLRPVFSQLPVERLK